MTCYLYRCCPRIAGRCVERWQHYKKDVSAAKARVTTCGSLCFVEPADELKLERLERLSGVLKLGLAAVGSAESATHRASRRLHGIWSCRCWDGCRRHRSSDG